MLAPIATSIVRTAIAHTVETAPAVSSRNPAANEPRGIEPQASNPSTL
jgi:hypothetical protein